MRSNLHGRLLEAGVNKKLAGLGKLLGVERLVRIESKISPANSHYKGFLVGISKRLLLLHVLEADTFRLNGYVVIRLKDIASYRIDETWISRGLQKLKKIPVVPKDIKLSNWSALLTSLGTNYPLLMLETEEKEPDIAFVGRVVKQRKQSIELKHVSRQGQWAEKEKFYFKDITSVIFGDGYVAALAHYVEHENREIL